MRLAVYLALLAAVLLSLVLVPAGRRLAPREGAVVLAAGSLLAGSVWVAALGLLTVATVGRIGFVAAVGRWSVEVLDARDPVPVAAGFAGTVVLLVAAVALAAGARRLAGGCTLVVRLFRQTRDERRGNLAVIDDPRPQAVALPGVRGSVLVTTGMLNCLHGAERDVLLAHEGSHVRYRHWAFRIATRLGATVLPTLRPAVARCDQLLERWADEDAALTVGDRTLVATAVARAALASKEHARQVWTPAMTDGAVAQRVEAMLAPARRSRRALAAVAAAVGVFALIALAEAGSDLESAFDAAKHVLRQ